MTLRKCIHGEYVGLLDACARSFVSSYTCIKCRVYFFLEFPQRRNLSSHTQLFPLLLSPSCTIHGVLSMWTFLFFQFSVCNNETTDLPGRFQNGSGFVSIPIQSTARRREMTVIFVKRRLYHPVCSSPADVLLAFLCPTFTCFGRSLEQYFSSSLAFFPAFAR